MSGSAVLMSDNVASLGASMTHYEYVAHINTSSIWTTTQTSFNTEKILCLHCEAARHKYKDLQYLLLNTSDKYLVQMAVSLQQRDLANISCFLDGCAQLSPSRLHFLTLLPPSWEELL